MLIWKKSSVGSIREANQDVVMSREDQGVVVIADGNGAGGREVAESLGGQFAERLEHLRLQANPETARERLVAAFSDFHRQIASRRLTQPGYHSCSVNVAGFCIVEGQALLFASGTCGLLARIRGCTLTLNPLPVARFGTSGGLNPAAEVAVAPMAAGLLVESAGRSTTHPQNEPAVQIEGPLPLTVGDWVMGFSEGFLVAQSLSELVPLAPRLHEDFPELAENLFVRASRAYDGDDRTMVMARILPQDLVHINADDIVVETHIDKTLTLPVWAPLLGAAALGILAWLLRPLLKYLPTDEE
jgi:hypothetical protein